MTEEPVMSGYIQPRCPQCGTDLLIEDAPMKDERDRDLVCPVHGKTGTVSDFHKWLAEGDSTEVTNEIGKKIGQQVGDMLRDAGWQVD